MRLGTGEVSPLPLPATIAIPQQGNVEPPCNLANTAPGEKPCNLTQQRIPFVNQQQRLWGPTTGTGNQWVTQLLHFSPFGITGRRAFAAARSSSASGNQPSTAGTSPR